MDFDVEFTKLKMIVARYDEVISVKANRQEVEQLQYECEQKYSSNEKQKNFIETQLSFFDGLQQIVNDKIKTFDHVANALTIKITTEIKKAKNELKPSAFNEMAN